MIGGESEETREQDLVNRKAAEKMVRLHDALKLPEKAISNINETAKYLVRRPYPLPSECRTQPVTDFQREVVPLKESEWRKRSHPDRFLI